MTSKLSAPRSRKIIIQMVAGGIFGFVFAFCGARLLPDLDRAMRAGAAALLMLGGLYASLGLIVGLGLLWPSLGARLLNVADRDDLDDQRAILTGSALCCLALGIALVLFALTGSPGPVSGTLALGAIALAIGLTCVVTLAQWRRYDELMRGVSLEASGFMAGISFPVIVLWAAAAQADLAPALDPQALVALIAGSLLAGTLVASARRGLLVPQ